DQERNDKQTARKQELGRKRVARHRKRKRTADDEVCEAENQAESYAPALPVTEEEFAQATADALRREANYVAHEANANVEASEASDADLDFFASEANASESANDTNAVGEIYYDAVGEAAETESLGDMSEYADAESCVDDDGEVLHDEPII